MDWTRVKRVMRGTRLRDLTDLHLRNIRVGRGVSAVGFRELGLGLAQVLAGGVEGSVGHCDGRCGCGEERVCVDVVDESQDEEMQ